MSSRARLVGTRTRSVLLYVVSVEGLIVTEKNIRDDPEEHLRYIRDDPKVLDQSTTLTCIGAIALAHADV